MADEDFWNSSDVKAFNFDDDASTAAATELHSAPASDATTTPSSMVHGIKTLDSVLAARQSTDEPFLKPSIILCDRDRINKLLTLLDEPDQIPQVNKIEPRLYVRDIVEKKASIDFSPYKSKRDKLALLDTAICYSDGNTITAAAIFLAKTIKESIFIEEIRRRPVAADHYLNYLELTGRSKEAHELTRQLWQ